MKKTLIAFLIDDDTDDQEIFLLAMKEVYEPCMCVFAKDGIDAMEKLNADALFIPDLIFIDMNMPRMNGVQCLAELKKVNRLQHVPAYMYSTAADAKLVDECKNLGAADFIKKPTDIDELKQNLIKILSL